ncbi:MAG: DUF4890 domain-containing protein [Prevotella sp.]|nr:DUF4890 domain-containing protein [Prevotella sp.]
MKKMIAMMAAAILMSSSVVAQDNARQGKRPERKFDKTEMLKQRTDETVKKYGLNDEQAKQLLELNTKYADKMGTPGRGSRDFRHGRPGRGQGNGGQRMQPTEEQKAKMAEARKERMAALEAYDGELQQILTAEQYGSYKADQQKRGQHPQRNDQKN